MTTHRHLIRAKLERSDFLVDLETDTKVTLSCKWRSESLRTFHINFRNQTVEYVMATRGLPARSWGERFETMEDLVDGLPTTIASFEQKFPSKVRNDGSGLELRTDPHLTTTGRDIWDITRYFQRPDGIERLSSTSLRLAP